MTAVRRSVRAAGAAGSGSSGSVVVSGPRRAASRPERWGAGRGEEEPAASSGGVERAVPAFASAVGEEQFWVPDLFVARDPYQQMGLVFGFPLLETV